MVDLFALPPGAPTDGFEYQWRRIPELGSPKDMERWNSLLDAGFLPYLEGNRPVDVKGMRLMCKPTEAILTQRVIDYAAAIEARDRRLADIERATGITAKSSFDGKPVVITAGHGRDRHVAVVARTPEGEAPAPLMLED
jgi:hypothetical protein